MLRAETVTLILRLFDDEDRRLVDTNAVWRVDGVERAGPWDSITLEPGPEATEIRLHVESIGREQKFPWTARRTE